MLMNVTYYAKMVIESDRSVNECRLDKMNDLFTLTSLRLALMIGYFLVMNSKRCSKDWPYCPSITTLKWWRQLCTLMSPRAMLPGVFTPGSATHAR